MRGSPRAETYLSQVPPIDRAVVCTIVRGEVGYGIERLTPGKRRQELEAGCRVPCPTLASACEVGWMAAGRPTAATLTCPRKRRAWHPARADASCYAISGYAAGFFKAWVRCPMGFRKTAPDDKNHQGPGRAIGAPEPGYPLSGCVPAEPDSVSPGSSSVSADQPYASTIGHRSYALKIPGRSPAHS
jgi:hypothetical protein